MMIFGIGRGSARRKAFTLFELMLALSVLSLIFTAVVISLQSKWQAEQARRGAQKVILALIKARSYAWRDGREWVVDWDSKQFELHAMRIEKKEVRDFEIQNTGDKIQESSSTFTVKLDPNVRLIPESQDHEWVPLHFFPNRRAASMSLLVVMGGKGDAWRVKTDWSGNPTLEPAHISIGSSNTGLKSSDLPIIEHR